MLFRRVVIALLATGLALSLASSAAAQATVDLTITGLEDGMTVAVGTDHPMEAEVTLTGSGFVCTTNSAFPVTLTVEQAAPDIGFNATLAPDVITFNVPAGAYAKPPAGGVPTSPYTKTEKTTLNVALGKNVPAGHGAHDFKIIAKWDGTAPRDCQAQGWPPGGTTAEVTHTVTPEFPADGTGGIGGPGTDGNGTDNGGSKSNEGPVAPSVVTIGLLLVIVAVLRRRR